MEHLYLWVPWIVVALIVGVLVYRRRTSIRPAPILLEAALVVVAYGLYYVVRGLTEGATAAAIDNAEAVIDAERRLRIYWEPRMQEFVLDYDSLVVLANWIYIWWHWPVIIVTAVWLFIYRPEAYRRYRDAFVLSGAVGLIFFALMPVAPPRLADPDIVDTIALRSSEYRSYETPALVNQYAAFPSLHFAWNLLASLAVFFEARHILLRAGAVVSPVVVLLAIVVTGNHFLLDAAAGAALALLALLVAHRIILVPMGLPAARRTAPHPD